MRDLTPFVPPIAVELGRTAGSRWERVDGSMLSADISGFTALSERLAAKGKAGAEQITELINGCFSGLINAASAYGGEVLKFGGDAILVLFRGDDHEVRGAGAALTMQLALANLSSARQANLTMTVGVAAGPFDVFLVGEPRREMLVCGRNASEVIHLEGAAAKGGTLISQRIAAQTTERLSQADGGGFMLRAAQAPAAGDGYGDVDLTPYVPGSLLEQLEAFSDLGGEHRLATIGFVMVTGVDELLEEIGGEAVRDELARLVNAVRDACLQFQVTFLHSDIAASGMKLILAAGVPLTSGHDEDAMLHAALAIAAFETPLKIRIGAQRGRVFAGFLGAPYRQAYTVMGDPVNTAARLLGQVDPGRVVATTELLQSTQTVFHADELEPFTVKGKSEPLHAALVNGATDEVRERDRDDRVVGREAELARMRDAVDRGGVLIDVHGAAGVGKSRLAQALIDDLDDHHVFRASCSQYGSTSPYSVFRALLRTGSGIEINTSAESAGRRLKTLVSAIAPQLLPLLPLLAVPFGATVGPTPETDAIDREFWRPRVHDAIIQFFEATIRGKILLVIEDVHWIDEASAELANELIRTSVDHAWSGLFTRRTGESAVDLTGGNVVSLELEPLDDASLRRLAIAASVRPLADADLDAIIERADGNALFARELALSLSISDSSDLPNSIEQVLSSRIDALPPAARRLLRVASVVGTSMSETDLQHVLDVEEPELRLADAELDGILHPADGGRWAFSSALYRDAAYEGLPFRHRLRLHRVVGASIEANAADPDSVASLLSVHYSIARVHDKAWRYSIIAARQAAAQHANVEAAAAFERALLSARYAGITTDERMHVAESLGDALFVLARFADARSAYEAGRKLASGIADQTRLTRKLGSVSEREGDATKAMRWYRKADRLDVGVESTPEILSESAQAKLAEAGLLHRKGDQHGCKRLADEALGEAQQAADRGTEALAYERMHLALTYLRDPEATDVGERALGIYRDLDDNSGIIRTLINLGIGAYFAGRWTEASERYLEATETGRLASSVVLAETAAINSAEILSDQGHWERAIELFEDARRNWEAVGYPAGVGAATSFLAVAQMRSGLLDQAQLSLKNARVSLEGIGLAELVDDVRAREIEWQLLAGQPAAAPAAELLDEFGASHGLAPRVLRTLGLAQAIDGDTAAAIASLTRSIELGGDDTYEGALSHHALALALPDHPDAVQHAERAASVFARLDVVEPPPVPTRR
ncbi:MAG: adenylate/guanylate cyclase domain-containing protein [Ilumatobacteraceae bacterium]|nr:adenylate/guanylate cyclase domain-containing protein [Ilumatobacteraceae bacterium]